MSGTTHPDFNEKTEGLEVAKAFAGEIEGKTVLITGVNLKGIGFATAKAFVSYFVHDIKVRNKLTHPQASQNPSSLVIAGRNPARVQESIDALRGEFPNVTYRALKLDLSSQAAVREAASEVLSWEDIPEINIIINNAAVMNIPERTITPDGLELQFATNHIGHFLFTSLIMSKLLAAASSSPKGATRIINVTSLSPTVAGMRWSDINFEKVNNHLPENEQPPYDMHRAWGTTDPEGKSYIPLEGYNQSKVANVLFTIGANARLHAKYGILSLAVHPGIMMTELSRYAAPETIAAITKIVQSGNVYVKTVDAGASTSLVAAVDPGLGLPVDKEGKENLGAYLMDCQISDMANERATSSDGAERLWRLSEQLVKEKFSW